MTVVLMGLLLCIVRISPNLRFENNPGGLHLLHCTQSNQHNNITLVSTVQENSKSFTKRQIIDSKLARGLVVHCSYPSDEDMHRILQSGCLHNFPVTSQDFKNATLIFGPSVHNLKGKTIRTRPVCVREYFSDDPPPLALPVHNNLTIGMDVMFVMNLLFLVTVNTSFGLITVEHLQKHYKEYIGVG